MYPINPSAQTSNAQNAVNKRPSTEPISTCAKKTVTPAMINTSITSNLNNSNQQNFQDIPLSGLNTDKLIHGHILHVFTFLLIF